MTQILAIDFETKPQNPKTGPDPYADPILLTGVWTPEFGGNCFDGIEVPEWVIKKLKDPQVLKLAHSVPFEAKFIKHNFGFWPENMWDTLAAERLITAGKDLRCSLDEVSLRRLGLELDKSIRANMERGVMTQKEKDYCQKDAEVLFPIYEQQLAEIEKNGQEKTALIENSASLISAEMEYYGIGFDVTLWDEYTEKLFLERGKVQGEIWEALGASYSIDLFSNVPVGGPSLNSRDKVLSMLKQVGILLKDYATSTLQEYLYTEQDPAKVDLIRKLLTYKKLDKMLGWNYQSYVNPKTSRVHASWNPQRADTFRWASNTPNMMQVSRPQGDINFRHLFRAKKGHVIVGADYSQIELRLLAYVTQDPKMILAFQREEDLHKAMAEDILGRDINPKSDERTLGKIANFGVRAYGGSWKAFMKTALDYGLYFTPSESKTYVKRIREVNEHVEQWGKRAQAELAYNQFIQTPVGHKRYFIDEDRETVARNTPIQMFAIGVLKDAMRLTHKELSQFPGSHFVLQVHDEVVLEVPEEYAEGVRSMVVEIMKNVGEKWAPGVGIKADSYISTRWQKG